MELSLCEALSGWAIVILSALAWDRYWVCILRPRLAERYKLDPLPDDVLIPRWAFLGMWIFGAVVIAVCFFVSHDAGF